MRRVLAAALVAVAACKSPPAARPSPAAANADGGTPAVADAAVARPVDDSRAAALASLEAARAARAQAERELLAGPESLVRAAADAQRCAEDAHRAGEIERSIAADASVADGADASVAERADASFADGAVAADADASVADGADASVQPAPQAVEALYLQAVCTAAWLRTQGFTPLIERRAELFQAFSRVARADPDLDGAGAERELGALFAELPANAGGDVQKARSHLEAAIARAPGEPRNHLIYARAVAVKTQDRALFERELAKVSGAAQGEARALLDREDDLFGPAQAAQPTPGGPQR